MFAAHETEGECLPKNNSHASLHMRVSAGELSCGRFKERQQWCRLVRSKFRWLLNEQYCGYPQPETRTTSSTGGNSLTFARRTPTLTEGGAMPPVQWELPGNHSPLRRIEHDI